MGHEPTMSLWLLLGSGLHHNRLTLGLISVVDLLRLLHWLLLDEWLKRIDVVRILDLVLNDVFIKTDHTVPCVPILSTIHIDTRLLLEFLEEFLLFLGPEVILLLWLFTTQTALLLELHLELAALLLISGVRNDAISPEVVKHLAWNLLESFLCQHHWVVLEVPEWHELNDISGHLLTIALRVEGLLIGIELVHGAEIG